MNIKCQTCGYVGGAAKKGSTLITIILLCFYIIPGLIYFFWRRSTNSVCPKCKSSHIVIQGYSSQVNTAYAPNQSKNKILIYGGILVLLFILVKLFAPMPSSSPTTTTNVEPQQATPKPAPVPAPIIHHVQPESTLSSEASNFYECRATVKSMLGAVEGTQYKTGIIADSGLAYIARICTNDGSVLLTCSKPDGNLQPITVTSSYCPL